MAGAPAGFGEYMAEKYAQSGQRTAAEANLANAQATSLTARTPFENALTGAQAFSTRQQGSTFQPLADASIRQTNDALAPVGDVAARAIARQMNMGGTPGATAPGAPVSPNGGWTRTTTPGGSAMYTNNNVADPTASGDTNATGDTTFGQTDFNTGMDMNDPRSRLKVPGFAEGTARVPAPQPAPAPVPGPNDTQTSGQWGPGQNQTLRDRVIRGYAGGTEYVGGDTDYREPAGGGIPWDRGLPKFNYDQSVNGDYPGYAKGTAKVPGKGGKGHAGPPHSKGPMMPPPPSMGPPGGAPAPAQMMAAMPPGPGGPPMPGPGGPAGAPSGLAGMLQAAMGATKVPGSMPPKGQNTDTVPAMLTPGEAVLNRHAAQSMGRDKIAQANARGSAAGLSRGMVKPPAGNAKGGNHFHFHIKTG